MIGRMRIVWRVALVGGLWILAGCSGDETRDGGLLVRDAGQGADSGAGADAAAVDTGVAEDAGFVDAGDPDTGVEEDAGLVDAASDDAGVVEDAGPADVGPEDAGLDAAVLDGGPTDATPSVDAAPSLDATPDDSGSAPLDAGPTDGGGPPDTGIPLDSGVAADAGAPDAQVIDAGSPDAGVGPMCNPSFGAADACAGAALGTWTYQAACSDQVPFASVVATCPGATVNNTVRAAGGTITLNPNGTFSRNVQTTVSGDAFVPQLCVSGGGLTCAQLGPFLPVLITGATGTCAQGAGGCDCQITVVEQINETGQFFATGSVVTTISGGITRDYWYCAQPGRLEYRGLPSTPTDNDTTYLLTP